MGAANKAEEQKRVAAMGNESDSMPVVGATILSEK